MTIHITIYDIFFKSQYQKSLITLHILNWQLNCKEMAEEEKLNECICIPGPGCPEKRHG
jgi:hypothetical protein